MINYSKINEEPMLFIQGDIVKDFSEFSGEDVFSITRKMQIFQELTKESLSASKDLHDFYRSTQSYIYDLLTAHWNMVGPINKLHKFLPGFVDKIKNHPGNKFLEFGGGIGDVCQIMAEWGNKDVTYMDIQSHITEFALWRFKKYNVPVTVQIIPQEDFSLQSTYDIIYQDAVLEHLPPEKQTGYTDKLCKGLNNNGLFIMIVDLSGESEDMPMHYNVDIVKVHDVIQQNGLSCLYGRNSFASVWQR